MFGPPEQTACTMGSPLASAGKPCPHAIDGVNDKGRLILAVDEISEQQSTALLKDELGSFCKVVLTHSTDHVVDPASARSPEMSEQSVRAVCSQAVV